MNSPTPQSMPAEPRGKSFFQRAIMRGLGVILPPILTIVIFIWIGETINDNILLPVTNAVRYVSARGIREYRSFTQDGNVQEEMVQLEGGELISQEIYADVQKHLGRHKAPANAQGYYERWVEYHYLQPYIAVPAYLLSFLALIYLAGWIMSAKLVRWGWELLEWILHRLPLVSNVYSSVKQVTNFMVSDQELKLTKVVLVEYPGEGLWQLGFVTGEGFLEVGNALKEPMFSLLMPTVPIPVTGYIINIPKKDVREVSITVDEAVQFCLSCGVVIPPHQIFAEEPPTTPTPTNSA